MDKIASKFNLKLARKIFCAGFIFASPAIGLSDSGESRSMTSVGEAYFLPKRSLVMDELEMRYQMELARLGEILAEDVGLDIEKIVESWS